LHTNRIYRPPRSPLADTAQFLILIAVLSWLLFQSAGNLNYNWQWYRVSDFLLSRTEEGFRMGPLLLGLGVTIKISAVSLVCTLVIGLMTALFRLSNSPVASLLARIYLEIIRNTPLLIQIYLIYYVLGPVLGLERFPAAVLALSLFQGAYASEIIRSGILSVDLGPDGGGPQSRAEQGSCLPSRYPATGLADDSATLDQPGNFTDQGFGPGLNHCHIRSGDECQRTGG
jgi:His/Glu/Gln/Arg/opine family amino acid ABC transporter permease subunit